MSNRFLRLPEVVKTIGLSKTTIYRLSNDKNNDFPKPVKLTGRTSAWDAVSIQDWIEKRIAASNG